FSVKVPKTPLTHPGGPRVESPEGPADHREEAPMDPTLNMLGAHPAMYDRTFEEVARPDIADMADEAGQAAWPMMGHVARLAASMDDEEAWDAVICAGLVEP